MKHFTPKLEIGNWKGRKDEFGIMVQLLENFANMRIGLFCETPVYLMMRNGNLNFVQRALEILPPEILNFASSTHPGAVPFERVPLLPPNNLTAVHIQF